METIWKDIEGYEGRYQCSNTGQIKSFIRDSVMGKILRPYKQSKGYLFITLVNDERSWPFLVHRIIAQTFLPNPFNLPHINHKDFDKTNNSVNNLEWMSAIDNYYHAYNAGRMKQLKKAS